MIAAAAANCELAGLAGRIRAWRLSADNQAQTRAIASRAQHVSTAKLDAAFVAAQSRYRLKSWYN
jgi:hypothetical protein